MKKFYFLLMAMLLGIVSSSATTVYFENTGNWTTVNAYCWSPNNKSWPGVEVTTTITASGRTFYKYDIPGAQQNLIFNNGSTQTKDLKVEDNAVYSAANVNSIDPIGHIENGVFVAAGEVVINYATIYIPVSNWDKPACYIYTWNPSLFGDWPGTQMTKETVNNINFWTIKIDDREITDQTIEGWKVNAGKGQAESGNIENGTVFKDGYVYTLAGESCPLADYKEGDTPIVNYGGWYLNVQGDFNGWNPEGAQYSCALSASGLGEVKDLVIGTGEFELKIWNGTNDIFMGTSTPVTPGKAVTVTAGGGHMTIAGATANSKYDVSFNAATNVMVVTEVGGDDPDPLPETGVYYQLHGQLTGNENWESVDMTLNGDVWEYTGTLVAGEFGIRKCYENSTETNWIGGGATVTETDKAYNFTDGGNSSSTLVGNYTVKYNPTAKTIEFVEAGEIEHVIGYALRGNIVSGEWSDYKMTEESDGNWSVTLTVVPGDFGIKKTDNGAQIGWYSAKSADEKAVSEAGEFAATGIGDTNWASTLEGEYKFSFNPDSETLTITSEGVEPEPTPIQGKFGIVGSMNEWNAANAIEMTNMGDNVYSYTFDRLEQGTEFKICDAKSWTHSWGGEGISRADEAPFVLENGVAANAWYNSSVNFQVGQNLTDATVLFKYNDNIEEPCEITLTGKTGIESIDVDNNAEVLYYNMQGQRVLNPTLGGMYIRVQGTKATKIAL